MVWTSVTLPSFFLIMFISESNFPTLVPKTASLITSFDNIMGIPLIDALQTFTEKLFYHIKLLFRRDVCVNQRYIEELRFDAGNGGIYLATKSMPHTKFNTVTNFRSLNLLVSDVSTSFHETISQSDNVNISTKRPNISCAICQAIVIRSGIFNSIIFCFEYFYVVTHKRHEQSTALLLKVLRCKMKPTHVVLFGFKNVYLSHKITWYLST